MIEEFATYHPGIGQLIAWPSSVVSFTPSKEVRHTILVASHIDVHLVRRSLATTPLLNKPCGLLAHIVLKNGSLGQFILVLGDIAAILPT